MTLIFRSEVLASTCTAGVVRCCKLQVAPNKAQVRNVFVTVNTEISDYVNRNKPKRDVVHYAAMLYRVMMKCGWINGTMSMSSLQLWIPVSFTSIGYQQWIYFTMYLCRSSTSISFPIYC
jgi:hypothetical protein